MDEETDLTPRPESAAPTTPGAELPARVGPYRVTGVLGRGGMGVVYAAQDDRLERSLAVKVIAPAAQHAAEARARFWREARALAAVDHPGVVRVHRIDQTPEGLLFLAMERAEGVPLADLLGAADRWPAEAVVELLVQVGAALGAAHAAGLTHRDIKPANLLVAPDGRVKVVDFGLARRAEAGDDRITETGAVLGTPAYMAPEQVEGRAVSPATDVFALGVVGYRLLAGRHPFARDSREATALALASGRFVPLREAAPAAPAALVARVEQCLAVAVSARPADGEALARALVSDLPPSTPADLARHVGLRLGAEPVQPAPPTPRPQPGPSPAGASPAGPSGPSLPSAPPAADLGSGLTRTRRGAKGRWATLALAVAGLGGALWWAGGAAPPPTPTDAGAGPSRPSAALSTRPVLAVLDLEAEGLPPTDPRPAVVAERIRRHLDGAPERLLSLSRETVAAMVGPEGPLRAPREALPARVEVVVSGRLAPDPGGGLRAWLQAHRRADGALLADLEFEVTEDAEEIALALTGALLEALGLPPVPAPPPAGPLAAEAAWLAAERALEQGDHDTHRQALARALRLAPDLVPARLSELMLLRLDRRGEDLVAAADRLARLPLGPRDAARLAVWRALAQERGGEALAAVRALTARWPYDVLAARLEMALRFSDAAVRDLAEAVQVCERILEVAPKEEDAASRLVRALATRGRAAEIRPTLARLAVPLETDAFAEVRGDVALMVGDFPAAIAAYDHAVALAGEDVYSLNMALAARILDGQCEAAAASALNRIDRVEAEGRDGNLDWTYSLSTQALICAGRFDALDTIFDRWAAHGPSGAAQVPPLQARVRWLRGEDPAALTAWLLARLLDPQTPQDARPALARTLARVAPDPASVERALRWTADRALDPAESAAVRRALAPAREALALRLRLLTLEAGPEPPDPAEVERLVADSAAAVPPLARLRDEGELIGRAEALARHAELLTALERPEEAAAAWRLVAEAGYGRLWTTDLWVLAEQALGRR